MAWLAVNKDGTEIISKEELHRDFAQKCWFSYRIYVDGKYYPAWISLPCGTIEKIIGRKLTWKDKSVEI